MDNMIKNTKFDNLVNYETRIFSNSSLQTVAYQSSDDPNSLSSILKNSPLIEYTLPITQQVTVYPD
jgi:hypothetical protein